MNNLSSEMLINDLLDLSDIEVTGIDTSKQHEITIHVKSTKKSIPCHRCGGETNPYGKGRSLRMRHLPILGKKTYIEITPPRGICPNCDEKRTTTTQTLDWYTRNAHHTKAYEQHILLSLVHSTIADVSIKEDIGDKVIQRIIDNYISEELNWNEIKRLGLIGIDEITLKKGCKDFLTVITSRDRNEIRILKLIKGREKAAIKAFLASIPKRKRKTIVAVCCDMYEGYINAAKETLGENIVIIVDRFHVAKLYREKLVKLRKKELARLKSELSKEDYQALKPAIEILVKKKECYSKQDKKILEPLFKLSPAIKAAYRLIRQLTTIFNTYHRKSTATTKLNQWIKKVEKSNLTAFNGLVKTLNKYQDEITNYFLDRNTSGFVEGFNNKIKVLKRRCYGIFNIKHFFQRIFLDVEGYKLFNINHSVIADSMPHKK